MRKFLLSCCLALGIGANAQITVNESFEGGLPTGITSTGGYTGTNGVYTFANGACDGTAALGAELYAGLAAARTVTITYTVNPSTSNGKKIDYSFKYITELYDSTSTIAGSIAVSYSRAATGNNFTTLGTATAITSEVTCSTISGTIDASTSATTGVPVNSPFRFRVVITTPNTSTNDFFFWLDAFKLTQETTVPPSCTTVTLPTTGANPNNNNSLTWTSAGGASNYKVYLGSTAGNYNIINGTSVTASSYSLAGLLSGNTTYFAKVVPTNAFGDATGCSEASFTTGAADYCTVKATADNSLDYISNVTYEGIANTTGAGATSYTAFASPKAVVEREGTKQISVTIATDPGYPNTDHLSAYIDWNQDKSFSANERVLLSSAVSEGTYTGNITVPSDAVLGDTKMRLIVEYNGLATYIPSPCNTTYSYGEVEDYVVTVLVKNGLAVSDVNKTGISAYPNPFIDVLRISDVKDVKSISINDMSGREVKSLAPSSEINLSSLNSGLYIINLKMEDGSVKTFKAIKK